MSSGIRRRTLSTGRYRTPNTVADVLIAGTGTWAHVGTIQAQFVRIAVIVRSRRPIAAVATPIAGGRRTEVAGIEEVIWEASPGFRHNCSSRSSART